MYGMQGANCTRPHDSSNLLLVLHVRDGAVELARLDLLRRGGHALHRLPALSGSHPSILNANVSSLPPLRDGLGIDAVSLRQRSYAYARLTLTILDCSTHCLCRSGAAVKYLSHNASRALVSTFVPVYSGTKHPSARPGWQVCWMRGIMGMRSPVRSGASVRSHHLAPPAILHPGKRTEFSSHLRFVMTRLHIYN